MQPAHKSSFTARFPSFLQKPGRPDSLRRLPLLPLFCDKSNGLAPFFQFAPGIKHAGFLGNQHPCSGPGPEFGQRFPQSPDIVPVDLCQMLHAKAANNGFNIQPGGVFAQLDLIHARIWLVARHGRGSVVQNDKQQIVAIVNRICKAGDARMKNVESPMKPTTILPDALAKPLPELAEEPMQTRKIRAFQQRWQKAKRVTANVAGIQGRIAKSLP